MPRLRRLLCSSCGAASWRIAIDDVGASYCDHCRAVTAHWPLPKAA